MLCGVRDDRLPQKPKFILPRSDISKPPLSRGWRYRGPVCRRVATSGRIFCGRMVKTWLCGSRASADGRCWEKSVSQRHALCQVLAPAPGQRQRQRRDAMVAVLLLDISPVGIGNMILIALTMILRSCTPHACHRVEVILCK